MNDLLITIGGLSILFGAYDLLLDSDNKDFKLKPTLVKIIGGLVIVGIGALFNYYKIKIF